MSIDRGSESQDDDSFDPVSERASDESNRASGVGDDERENRQHIADTGEPKRDKLGNADGAS